MPKFVKWLSVLISCLLIAACMPAKGIREEFETSVKGYNRMLRWREIPAAGPLYVVPEGRDQYIATAESIKKREVTITDYRILTMDFLEEKLLGDAVVEFDYYVLPSNRIKTLTYKQDWVYREMGKGKERIWKVKSPLPAFD